ncbi:hypothetical protein Tco_0360919 [Tanacetum coccineum]
MARYGADGVTIFSLACIEVCVTTKSELHFYRAGVNNNHFRHKAPVRGEPARSPVQRTDDEKTWCIPKTRAHEKVLQANYLALDVNRPGERDMFEGKIRAVVRSLIDNDVGRVWAFKTNDANKPWKESLEIAQVGNCSTMLKVQIKSGNPDYEVIRIIRRKINSVMELMPESLRVTTNFLLSIKSLSWIILKRKLMKHLKKTMSNAFEEDVASHAELAKAYMGTRPAKVSPSTLRLGNQAPRQDSVLLNNTTILSRMPITSLLTKNCRGPSTISKKLQGDKTGRNDSLVVATKVFEVAPSLHMVELRKTGSDTLEFHNRFDIFVHCTGGLSVSTLTMLCPIRERFVRKSVTVVCRIR